MYLLPPYPHHNSTVAIPTKKIKNPRYWSIPSTKLGVVGDSWAMYLGFGGLQQNLVGLLLNLT
jgi:hypothetical protein